MLSWMTRPLASAAKQADAAARKAPRGKPRPPHGATLPKKR
jgi:hypothetical protein